MSKLRYATYVGPRRALKGKTALARRFGDGKLRFQFDDLNLNLAYGWHQLPRHHVRIVNR